MVGFVETIHSAPVAFVKNVGGGSSEWGGAFSVNAHLILITISSHEDYFHSIKLIKNTPGL